MGQFCTHTTVDLTILEFKAMREAKKKLNIQFRKYDVLNVDLICLKLFANIH